MGISNISITPHASSILELRSTTLGFLPPRMTTTQRDSIASPAAGLVVYNTTTNQLNYYNGSSWQLTGGGGITSLNGLTGTSQTFVNGTNVTLTSTGTTHTLGWTGQLSVANGGTGLSSLGGTNSLLFTTTTNNISSIATSNNGTLVTNGSGVPSISSTLPSPVQGNITTLGTISSGTWNGTAIGVTHGGTGNISIAIGELLYGSATNTIANLAAGTSGNFLKSSGAGAPSWSALTNSDVGLGNVENTALSTWAGTTNITTVGTIATGTWNATTIADGKIASTLSGKTYNALTLSAQAVGFTIAGGTTSKTLTVPLDASVSGTNTGDQATVSGNAGSATLTAITDDNATAATMYPTWVSTTSGNLAQKVSSTKLSFTPSTGTLTSVAFVGALTGNVTGNITGSSGSTTGNAATVTTNANLTGDVTSTGNASTIAANVVTYSKFQQVATNSLLGRSTAGTGNIELISLGSGLSLTAGTLSATNNATVTSFSSGNLSPLFTTSVSTSTSTPALSFVLSNASANTYFGNATGSSAAPSFSAAAALTKTDDANVTLTLGGSPSTSLLTAASLTLGWTGQLAVSRGGTGSSTQNFVDLTTNQTIAGAKTFTSVVIGVTPTLSTHLTTKGYVDGAFIPLTQKAANNGVATLDAGGKIPSSQLPTGALIYKGTWNASTNTPTLSDATGVNGWDYTVSVAGSQDLGSGSISFDIGDEIIHNGSIYQVSPSAATVTSVNGLQGVVVLSTSDIDEGTNLYYTDARPLLAPLTGYSAGTNTVLASGNSILTAFQNVQGQLNARESVVTAGTTSQYWRGDKTFQTLDKTAVGLSNVENTALSTWTGTTNVTTLGTIATGTWNATPIADGKIASALTGKTYNAITLSAQATGFTIAGGTTSKTLTVPLDATVSGTNTGDQATVSGNAGSATLTAITDDNSTAATMYPTWVTTTTGNLAQKVSSTKLSFTPSTGTLTSVAFAGALTGNVTGNLTGNASTVTTNANLTGDVTSTGNASTIAANVVTYSKFQQVATNSLLGRSTAATGNIELISLGSGLSLTAGTLSATNNATVTSFSSGNLSPLFTTSVSTFTSTPALSFVLSNASANTYFGNATGSSAAPSFSAAAALTKTDDANV
ncbi:MAG TPA: hypothetical protein VE978_26630, partial [Chitinophagales bacterium]|nr:hypothetical protein [Chitinophagales bacterium]